MLIPFVLSAKFCMWLPPSLSRDYWRHIIRTCCVYSKHEFMSPIEHSITFIN